MSRTIHAILVAFDNPEQTLTRWTRDVKPGLDCCFLPYRVTVVDNSPRESKLLADHFRDDYLWQEGRNLMYGGAINLAVSRLESDFILYACTRHGKMFHHGWVRDLIRPLENEPQVGMTGYLMGSNSPEGVAHAMSAPWVAERFRFDDGVKQHIQGGVFAARTDAMRRHPYPPELLHNYSDHFITWAMLKDGYEVRSIHTIMSVWRDTVADPEKYWYVHAEGLE